MSAALRAAVMAQLAGVTALLLSTAAQAELNLSAEVGVGHSDNIGRVSSNEVDETIATAGLQLDWLQRSRRIRGDATVDVSYFDYLDNTYDSEVVGTANASLALGIVPDTLHWVVADTFGQAQADPFVPVTPGNRENINYFTTGPDLMLRMGDTGFARLFGRWSQTTYERSALDAQRTTGGVTLGRRGSARGEITLNALTERIRFDDAFNPDYDRDSVYLGYRLDGGRTVLNTELGYTWLDRDNAADRTGSALINVSMTRELTASSELHLRLGTQLGDASDALRGALDGGITGGGVDITAAADPFENRVASLHWRFERNRSSFSLGGSWNEDRYETLNQFDRTRYVYDATFGRQLTRTLTLEVLASLQDERFDNVDLSNDELRLQAALNYRGWRTLGLRLTAERLDRNSSGTGGGLGALGDFTENRVFLTLAYYWRGNQPR